jgi:hypothetical protein
MKTNELRRLLSGGRIIVRHSNVQFPFELDSVTSRTVGIHNPTTDEWEFRNLLDLHRSGWLAKLSFLAYVDFSGTQATSLDG